MIKKRLWMGGAAAVAILVLGSSLQAQCATGNCGVLPNDGQCTQCPNRCCTLSPTDGMSIATCPCGHRNYAPAGQRLVLAARDGFSPQPFYAYSRSGIDAQRIHQWNASQAAIRPWHGGYNYWQYRAPTALVVPPTAAFQSQYAWGVGQTRSLPIYHQFGFPNPGGGAGGGEEFANTPYWPMNTNQFGVYPVRGPWE